MTEKIIDLIKTMPNIKFPDGNSRFFDAGVNGFIIAESISKSLIKNAVAISINGVREIYRRIMMMLILILSPEIHLKASK